MGDVIKIEGTLRKQNFTRTERNEGKPDTRFHKMRSVNGTRNAYYPKLKIDCMQQAQKHLVKASLEKTHFKIFFASFIPSAKLKLYKRRVCIQSF